MTPLASVVVLFAVAIAVVALFAVWMRSAATDGLAVLPDPEPAPAPAPALAPAALEGALAAGD